MSAANMRRLAAVILWLCGVVPCVGPAEVSAQAPADPATRLAAPLRTPPTVAWESQLGFRDWGAAVRAGGVLIATRPNGGGGLFALDDATGTLRWRTGTEHASDAPVSDGKTFAVAYWQSEALAAYTVADGKPVWRKPMRFVRDTALALADGNVLALSANDGTLYALDLATGDERWKLQVTPRHWHCGAGPVVVGDSVYVASALQSPADAKTDFFLHAIDLKTGQERWRYNPPPEYPNAGVCLNAIVVAGETVVATGDGYLYGVDRQTGRQTYRVEALEGKRRQAVTGLVAVANHVFAVTATFIEAVDAKTGRTAWKVPGRYRDNAAILAAADGVLYVEGHVTGVDPEPQVDRGILHALDVTTREVLWTFTHQTETPWSFDHLMAVDGGLYVDTYKRLLKLK
jgi:outer membrane protein assembly factor BamB